MPLKESPSLSSSSQQQQQQQQQQAQTPAKDTYSFNICLVGLSGPESLKGVEGVGKSCVCSRFMANKQDEYRKEHTSNISLSDWHSLVVNRNHWLYWGHRVKQIDDSLDLVFHLIEQTEFISDESMRPFDDSDIQPYYKRCSNVKLVSPQKCVYRRPEQFALPEYNYGKLPSDSLQIDGFICVFDITDVQRRPFQNQLNELQQILTHLIKTKKPILLITTKNENFKQIKPDHMQDLEKLLQKKEFSKSTIYTQIIETSAHLNINIDLAFFQLALLINSKSLHKYRTQLIPTQQILKFPDAYELYQKYINEMKLCLQNLLSQHVQHYKFKYEQFYVVKKYELNKLIDLFGIDYIIAKFGLHLNTLKEQFVSRKVNEYLLRLPKIIEILYENEIDKLFFMNNPWNLVADNMRKHKLFDRFILKSSSSDLNWYENEVFEANGLLLPFDVFSMNDKCKGVFENYVKNLKDVLRIHEAKDELLELLKANALKNYIQAGKQWNEVSVLLIGRECYEYLNDEQRKLVYEQFQKELILHTKLDYIEALNENCELFCSKIFSSNLTTQDVDEIIQTIKHDQRHTALDKLQEERKGLVLKHIAFLLGKSRSQYCAYGGTCIDLNLQNYMKAKYHLHNNSNQFNSNCNGTTRGSNRQLRINYRINIVLFVDKKCLSAHLLDLVKVLLKDDKFHYMNRAFSINYKILTNEQQFDDSNLFNDFQPDCESPTRNCIICGCNNTESLNYLRNNLNKILKNNDNRNGSPLATLCFVTHLNVYDISCDQVTDAIDDTMYLYKEDLKLFCETSNYKFLDNFDDIKMQNILIDITTKQIENETKDENLLNQFQIKLNFNENYENDEDEYVNNRLEDSTNETQLNDLTQNKRLNLLCCIMCQNDMELVDTVLSPFFNQDFYRISTTIKSTATNSILIEAFDNYNKQLISIEVISYHLAFQYLYSKKAFDYDGFMLVYSVKRFASFQNAKSLGLRLHSEDQLSSSTGCILLDEKQNKTTIPCCVIATITDNVELDVLFNDELSTELLHDGNKLADSLNARFLTARSKFASQSCAFSLFFEDCFAFKSQRKSQVVKPSMTPVVPPSQQQIEIVLEDYRSDENLHAMLPQLNRDLISAPAPTIRPTSTLYDQCSYNELLLSSKNNKVRSTSADIYLQPSKVKSSSSSNLSIHFENNTCSLPTTTATVTTVNNNYKPFQSAIYSTESIASTSSLSSNLLNSTSPSPSYQRNKSQELDCTTNDTTTGTTVYRPQSNELQIPKTYRNAYILSKSNQNDSEISRITQATTTATTTNEPINRKTYHTIELQSIADNYLKNSTPDTVNKPLINETSKRRLSNAPLARAESIDIETKKQQQQQMQFIYDNLQNTIGDKRKYLNSKKNEKSDEDSEELSSSVNDTVANMMMQKNDDTNFQISTPLSMSLTSPLINAKKPKKPLPYKFKSKTSKLLLKNEPIKLEPNFYETEDVVDEKGKPRKLKRKKSNSKIKSQIFNRGGGGGGDNDCEKANKSLDDLRAVSSCDNTQINSRTEESEDGTQATASMTVAASLNVPANKKTFVDKISKKITSLSGYKKYQASLAAPSTAHSIQAQSAIQSPIQFVIIQPMMQAVQDSGDGCMQSMRNASASSTATGTTATATTASATQTNPMSLQLIQQAAFLANSFAACNSSASLLNASGNGANPNNNNNRRSYGNNDFICIENDALSSSTGIPLLVEKCIAYIEEFGVESEGIYRVPGHKQYTDSLFDDFLNRQEAIDLKSYNTSQINVNIVATVIKEYFRHLKEPIIGNNLKEYIDLSKTHFGSQNANLLVSKQRNGNSTRQLTPPLPQAVVVVPQQQQQVASGKKLPINMSDISGPIAIQSTPSSSSLYDDSLTASSSSPTPTPFDAAQLMPKQSNDLTKESLIESIKQKFLRLNRVNYVTLKAVFCHLNLIAANSSKNNMDSNNLAICWWPTLLRPKFEDFYETEILRKTLQPLIKFIIDQAQVIFEEPKYTNDLNE